MRRGEKIVLENCELQLFIVGFHFPYSKCGGGGVEEEGLGAGNAKCCSNLAIAINHD